MWKQDAVVSIPVRPDLFVLAQMLRSPYLLFFDLFAACDDWHDVDLDRAPTLFFRGVTRQFLRFSGLRRVAHLRPRSGVELPRRWLKSGPGSQRVCLWPGTPDELEVVTLGEEGLRVVEKGAGPGFVPESPVTPYLTGPDHPELDLYELDSLGVYPETVERLYLCHLFGKNVDPEKDLICGRALPAEYRAYFAATMR